MVIGDKNPRIFVNNEWPIKDGIGLEKPSHCRKISMSRGRRTSSREIGDAVNG